MEVLLFVAGVAVGAFLCWLALRKRLAETENLQEKLNEVERDNTALRARLDETGQRLQEAKEQHRKLEEFLQKTEERMREAFDSLALKALRESREDFVKSAQEHLETLVKEMRGGLETHKAQMGELVTPLKEALKKMEKSIKELEEKREGAYSGLREQIKQLLQSEASLKESAEALKNALKAAPVRGRWGELQLRRLVELAGMQEHVDFDEQTVVEEGLRPDMVIKLPRGGMVPVDSKLPLNSYLKACEATEEKMRETFLNEHVRALRGHLNQLSSKKYWAQFGSSVDVVVMFVPIESSWTAALEKDPSLLEEAINKRVLITTPMTLFALLKAIAYGWMRFRVAENIQMVAQEGRRLYERLLKFAEHLQNLGKRLDSAVKYYNDAIRSFERRLAPSARKFAELSGETKEVEVTLIENRPIPPQLPETERQQQKETTP